MEGNMGKLEKEIARTREYFRNGNTRDYSWRYSQLQGLLSFIKENQFHIFQSLMEDLGKHHVEAYRDEVGTLIKTLHYALKNLKKWMSNEKAKLPRIAILTTAELVPEPLGLVLIISSWNFPFGISLEPLIGAIAAGNTVVLKPSELCPASASVLADIMPNYLDTNALKVVQGGPNVGEFLLQQKWDKIFFTGSTRVGRIVMSAAAKHLTPIVLELGGKCPGIVDSLSSSWDKQVDKIEESIEFVNSRPKPLAIYAFTKNDKFSKRLEAETSSGSLIINDAIIQYAGDSLPFGGVGESGMGKYHGKFSFEAFTHYKVVIRRSFLVDFWFRFPPWNDHKLLLFESVYNDFDYLGMLLVILRLKRNKSTSKLL